MTIISRWTLPDHDGSPIEIVSPNGDPIGTLTFDTKGTSRLDLAPGQQPYRPVRLKRKHRAR